VLQLGIIDGCVVLQGCLVNVKFNRGHGHQGGFKVSEGFFMMILILRELCDVMTVLALTKIAATVINNIGHPISHAFLPFSSNYGFLCFGPRLFLSGCGLSIHRLIQGHIIVAHCRFINYLRCQHDDLGYLGIITGIRLYKALLQGGIHGAVFPR
jgi:hypothetical protein